MPIDELYNNQDSNVEKLPEKHLDTSYRYKASASDANEQNRSPTPGSTSSGGNSTGYVPVQQTTNSGTMIGTGGQLWFTVAVSMFFLA
jgi:hypothetical protein